MPRQRARDPHLDLFALESPQLPMAAGEQRTDLVALVSALLTQALTVGAAAKEASDEDHA